MKTKSLLLLSLLISVSFIQLVAQEITSAAGGNITGTGGSVSFTVGQVANLYLEGSGGSVAQGVQLPFEIFLVTGIEEAKGISLNFLVYPNPVQHFLNLKIQGITPENLVWEIYDLAGKLLQSEKIAGTETLIPMSDFASGIYLFSVVNKDNLQYKTFQIIKN